MFWFRRFLVIGIIAHALTAGAGGPDDRIFTDSFESCKDFVVPEGAVEKKEPDTHKSERKKERKEPDTHKPDPICSLASLAQQ